MQTGKVNWFSVEKGYGFITPDGGGPDVFVHATALQHSGLQDLQSGITVSFETYQNPNTGRLQARNIKL